MQHCQIHKYIWWLNSINFILHYLSSIVLDRNYYYYIIIIIIILKVLTFGDTRVRDREIQNRCKCFYRKLLNLKNSNWRLVLNIKWIVSCSILYYNFTTRFYSNSKNSQFLKHILFCSPYTSNVLFKSGVLNGLDRCIVMFM